MSLWVIGLAITLYFYLIFQVAIWGERRGSRPLSSSVYVLSLAVYCTSWTYYGSIGRASVAGISFFAVYVGPILVFVLAQPFLRKLLRVCQAQRITSISDFLAARYGKSAGLAVLAALTALFSVLPYLALQLKAVADSLLVITRYPARPVAALTLPFWSDPTFWLAVFLSVFVIAFGTRRADASEQHRGMTTVVGLESLIKLVVFLTCAVVVLYSLGGWGQLLEVAETSAAMRPLLQMQALGSVDFWLVALLGACVIVCVPRQFQVMVVENTNPDHLRTSRWAFPLYLLAITFFVIPLALAGLQSFPAGQYHPDTFMLALPLHLQHPALALAVFIGGLSAATAMVIVETIALATMVSNDLMMPWLIGRHLMHQGVPRDVARWVKPVRRLAIVGLLLLSYGFIRLVGNANSLAAIGLMSFVAVSQFAPALVGGLYWRRGHWRGAAWGLVCGFWLWVYTLLLPVLAQSGFEFALIEPRWIWLRPQSLFGIEGLSLVGHSTLVCLAVNTLVYVVVSYFSHAKMLDRQQAAVFVLERQLDAEGLVASGFTNAQLLAELEYYIEPERLLLARQRFEQQRGKPLNDAARPDINIQRWAETQLAGALGAAMARVVLVATLQTEEGVRHVTMGMLSEAQKAIQSSWDSMRTTLDNIAQGVCMFDQNQQLLVWNRRVFELLDLAPELACVGTPIARFLQAGLLAQTGGDGEPPLLLAGTLQLASGRVLEWQWRPLQGGGLVGTFTDITAQKEAEHLLESKVQERTFEVMRQKQELEREHDNVHTAHRNISLLSEIGREITTSLDRETIMQSVYRHVHQLMEVDAFAIGLLDDVQGVIDFCFCMEHGQRGERQTCHLNEADQLAAWCIAQRQEILINDLEVDYARYIAKTALPRYGSARSLIFVPLLLKTRVLGVISVRSGKKHGYETMHLDMMTTLAAYAAVALDNAHAYQQLHSLQEKLLAQEKMAALAYLVGGIAHELNTPIGNSLLMASSLTEMSDAFSAQVAEGKVRRSELESFSADARHCATHIQRNLDRVSSLVNSFKDLAVSQQSAKRKQFNLQHVSLDIVANMMEAISQHGHAIALDIPEELELDSYPGAWGEVLVHLVNNALLHAFAGKSGGHIRLLARQTVPGWVQIRFSDDGNGIEEDHLRRIFDPFFTTRLGSGQNGLGLHIVYNLISGLMGGQISVKSKIGEGTVFTIELPLSARV
jgi:Na+/proline symporter/signal transduction histidine kinase